MKKSLLAMIIAVGFTMPSFAAAPTTLGNFTTPKTVNFQGALVNPTTGSNYTDGIYTLDLKLYRQASGGTAIWGGRYSVYVKNGYFNVMLGDTSGTDLTGTTYANSAIWRAFWNDTTVAVSQRATLWLGVTIRQNHLNQTIASPVEISPRQQLLAVPYAFTAQSAYYATEAYSSFKVPGTLTVTGALTGSTSYDFTLRYMNSTSSTLNLGSSTSSPSSVNLRGETVNVNTGSALNFNPGTNVKFTINSGRSLLVNGGYFAVTNTLTTIKSSSTVDVVAQQLNLTATSVANIKVTGSVYLDTNYLYLRSGTHAYMGAGDADQNKASIYVNKASGVVGQANKLKWARVDSYGNPYTAVFPFCLKKVTVTIPANAVSATSLLSSVGLDTANYKWVTCNGYTGPYLSAAVVMNGAISVWPSVTSASERTATVYVMGIHVSFCDDQR